MMRIYIKNHYSNIWHSLIKLRYGIAIRSITSFPNLINGRILRAHQAPFFYVNLCGSMGLGAILSSSVGIFHYCDQHGLLPYIKFTNPNYSSDPANKADWLGEHFIRKNPSDQDVATVQGKQPGRFLVVRSSWDLSWQRWDNDLTIERAGALFHHHLSIRSEITDAAEQFAAENFGEADVLGVHFRGTDKFFEAPRVKWEALVDTVNQYRSSTSTKIFVATDEPEFLDFMLKTYGRQNIIDMDCREIYSGSRPAHITAGDPFVKAREAIMTMLLLSKCRTCIRTPSHLSAWAKILNPKLEVIMVAKPIGSSFHFPDRRIWEECQTLNGIQRLDNQIVSK